MMRAAILVVILLSVTFLIPQAQASSVTEFFPTSTSVIIAGWSDPTEAYASDSVYASSLTDNAEQEYSGFGFNFNATDTIEKVYISIKMALALYIQAPTMAGDFIGNVKYYDYNTMPIPLRWRNKVTCNYEGFTENGLDNATNYQIDYGIPFLLDITNFINDYLHVNNLKLRLKSDLILGDAFLWEVDVLSVVVSYSTEKMSFTSGFMLGGVLCGLVALVAVLLVERKD